MAKKTDDTPKPGHNLEGVQWIEKRTADALKYMEELMRVVSKTIDEAEAAGNRAADLIALYRRIYDADEQMTEMLKSFGNLKNLFKYKLLPEAYDREQISTLTTSERDRVTVTQTVRASVLAENREELFEWLRENNHGELIQETVNAGTLSSFVKAEMEEMRWKDQPFVKVDVLDAASLTRGTKPAKKLK